MSEATVSGNEVLARTLSSLGVTDLFYLMGGPLLDAQEQTVAQGIRGIDVRHEQAAAMMAHAYSRVTGRTGVCMACSGPGALNLLTGIATAWADGCPVVALGGSSPTFQSGMGSFQEVDQLACFAPVTKWSTRLTVPDRIPEVLEEAFRRARTGRPGPVYVDLPGDLLYRPLPAAILERLPGPVPERRALADPADVARAARLLAAAERPLILSGSGVIWSEAWDELRELVDRTGIPFYTTPQGRGVIDEDHPLALLTARSAAFREADVVLVVGTRLNYMVAFGRAPRFHPAARFIQLDIDAEELGQNRTLEVGLLGDAKLVLGQLRDEAAPLFAGRGASPWVAHLREVDARKATEAEAACSTDQRPIHPLRLAKEIRDFLDRDAILCVDGADILNFARQTIPSHLPRHRLNSGVFGTMGVGLPFGIGAKVAAPSAQVLVLHGDGSFGMNAMEMDTAIRHRIPVVCVVANNAGWTGLRGTGFGRELGHTRYERMFADLGAHAEHVTEPQEIRPALARAFASGRPALVNVITDPRATADTATFAPIGSSRYRVNG